MEATKSMKEKSMKEMKATKSFEFDYQINGKTIHLQREGQHYDDVYKYAISLKLQYEKHKNLDGDWQITLPIKKINEVKCEVNLRLFYCRGSCRCSKGKRGQFQIIINDTKVYCRYNEDDDDEDDFFPELYRHNIYLTEEEAPPTIINFVKAIMILHYYLENLKFNKLANDFDLYDRLILQSLNLGCVVFQSQEIELAGEMCPCCREYTTFQLRKCRHYICIPCKSSLPKEKCPTCRRDIYDTDDEED
jgi:hypothetical protein